MSPVVVTVSVISRMSEAVVVAIQVVRIGVSLGVALLDAHDGGVSLGRSLSSGGLDGKPGGGDADGGLDNGVADVVVGVDGASGSGMGTWNNSSNIVPEGNH